MAMNLSTAELHAEHVELLPARTLVSALLVPVQTTGAGFFGALSSGAVDSAPGGQCDVPWWAPKPPGC
jgi:hypothetical protein